MEGDEKVRKGLAKSLLDPRSYPKTVERTYKSSYALAAYRDRLEKDEAAIFVPNESRRSIFFWDLADNNGEFQLQPMVSTLEQLKALMGANSAYPRSRFIFMQTAGSRGPLRCSPNQLIYILAYYQVMPSFLDFCFEFRKRELVTTNMFRLEDFLPARDLQSTPSSLGQRESRIQHAFNIMAFEEDTMKDPQDKEQDLPNNWLLRHTTVYHSFDIQQARSLWVVIKGNKTIRDRLTLSPESQHTENVEPEKLLRSQFKASLCSHLHILEWGTENWGQYVDDLAERSRRHISTVKHAPVELLANKPRIALPKHTPIDSRNRQRTGTGLSRAPTVVVANMRRAFSAISGISTSRQGADSHDISTALNNQVEPGSGENDERLDKVFTFDDLQEAHRLAGMVRTANLVIDQNLRILAQLRVRYSSLARREELSLVTDDILDFVQQIGILEGDLEGHQSRIRALIRSLEMNEEMFKGILGYGNMRTGQHFAKSAQVSSRTMETLTEKMHKIATKTEQETISMHVITVFTLIFLPGTFVCTFFSAEIMDFTGGRGTGRIGDWVVRWSALKLFLAFCLPLMAVTLSIWGVTYQIVRRQHKSEASALALELPANIKEE